jgi:hypothetical protein
MLLNSGDAGPIVVDTAAFRQKAQVTLEQQDSVGVNVRWLPERTPLRAEQAGQAGRVTLPMGRGIGLPVVITLLQGRFSAGTYRLKLSLGDIWRIASGMSSDVLPLPVAGAVAVTLVEPVTGADRASASRQMGHAAQKRGQLEEAEQHFRAAADLQAEATAGIGGMYDLGVIYLQRKKYREAISCFERLVTSKSSHGEMSLVPELLAQGYIGIGDDVGATRVLERAGVPDTLLATTLDRLRQAVSRRQ